MSRIDYSSIYQKITRLYGSLPRLLSPGWSLPPLQVFLEVTYKCNLRCDFCQFLITADADDQRPFPAGSAAELSSDQFKDIIRDLPKTAIVSFTGGEPFVKDGFMELLEYASGRNKTHVFTNGTLIDDTTARDLIGLGAKNVLSSGLVLIGVSLEGLEATHNEITQRGWAFGRTVSGLQALLKYRQRLNKKYPLIELKTVISRRNLEELHEIFLLAKEIKVDIFNVMSMNLIPQASRLQPGTSVSCMKPPPPVERIDPGTLKKQLARITKAASGCGMQVRTTPLAFSIDEIVGYYDGGRPAKKYRCYYPWYGVAITPYGEVSICPYASIGNVEKGGLRRLLNNTEARAFREELKKRGSFPGCWGCCMLVPENNG